MKHVKINRPDQDAIKDVALLAATRIIDPLLNLIFDAGISIPELTYVIRERSVRVAAERALKKSGRISKSAVAISTGLPRTEVSRILNSPDLAPKPSRGQNPARRVLSAWYDDEEYLTKSGEPAALPIFGKRQSFESLVTSYGGGIPVRAMLDELTELEAVDRLPNQTIRPRARLMILSGMTQNAISAVGERGRDFLATLTGNVRNNGDPLFEATAVVNDADSEMVALIRREVVAQGSSFINNINSLLNRSRKKKVPNAKSSTPFRVGVTAFYFQDEARKLDQPELASHSQPRKNLRRVTQSKTRAKRKFAQ